MTTVSLFFCESQIDGAVGSSLSMTRSTPGKGAHPSREAPPISPVSGENVLLTGLAVSNTEFTNGSAILAEFSLLD